MVWIIALLVIVGLAVYISRQPDEFRVTRSMTMAASPDKVFEQVNNLRKWPAWSPWAKMDPDAVNTLSGPEAGVDAAVAWVGKKTGVGKMTITESNPVQAVKFRLDFEKPMKATNMADFTFAAEGSGTNVTWSMYGKNTLMGKMMSLVMNCEKMIGGQFEQGLTDLKKIVESA